MKQSSEKNNAFEKRIRRQVVSRIHDFFAAVAPGLEPLCRDELRPLLPELDTLGVETGGVTFSGRLHDLYRVALHGRTPTRILMRLITFKATGFHELEKHAAEFPWELHLPAGCRPEVRVTTHRCRLYHSEAVAQRITAAVARRLLDRRASAPGHGDSPWPQTLFVRGIDDRFTLSLDAGGAPLYRRGIKTHGGKAPLRETLAAAILRRAGYTGDEPLIDPMCGTGTFSLEGAMMARRLPAGWFREFAFMDWPGFQEGRWRHLRREAESNRRTGPVPAIAAADTNPEACRRLSRSLAVAGLDNTVTVACADFFDLTPKRWTGPPGLVVLNPPYGRRIGTAEDSPEQFARIIDRLTGAWTGWRVALLAPNQQFVHRLPAGLERLPLPHGGLKLTLVLGGL